MYAARAGAILDQHLLAPDLGELLRHMTRRDVRTAARREPDDDADRLRGKVLRRAQLRDERSDDEERGSHARTLQRAQALQQSLRREGLAQRGVRTRDFGDA